MNKGLAAACILGLMFISTGAFTQGADASPPPVAEQGAPPEALRRPERGEAARYPQDMVIGELGQGEAPEAAYLFARRLLSELVSGRPAAGGEDGTAASNAAAVAGELRIEALREEIRGIRPRSYRLGGGREEADGCVSFLLRFLGREESIAGELFLRQHEGAWILDDLLLEEKKAITDIRDDYRYDFSPYERFY